MTKLKLKYTSIITLITILLLSCQNTSEQSDSKTQVELEELPDDFPLTYRPDLTPDDQLIHRGVFSTKFDEYYYTLSDKNFQRFDIKYVKKENDKWSAPKDALINSHFSDHGMSFSPDGKYLYFSSTRPVNIPEVADTWHLWRSEKVNGKWTEPTFIDIPNLRNKLVSHPTVSKRGDLYFHVSNLDYSDMEIYHSKQLNGVFQEAVKVEIPMKVASNKCTPYVSPDNSYLIFATVGKQLDLMISFRNENGEWTPALALDHSINDNGQGNPSVTSDGKFLLFTTGTITAPDQKPDWNIKWIDMESVLTKLGSGLIKHEGVVNG